MAWSVDQQLGTVEGGNGIGSFTLTTTNAVTAGGMIVVGVGFFNSGAGSNNITVSGGSLTWSTAIQLGTGTGADGSAICWALAPAGLASSTVLTVNSGQGSSGFSSPIAGATSFLGSAASSPLDGTGSHAGTTLAWTGGSIVTAGADDLVVGVGWADGNTVAATDTPTSPWVQSWLKSDSGANGGVTTLIYRLGVASGSYTPGGTFAGTGISATAAVGAGFKGVSAAGAVFVPRRMPLGC